MDEENVSRNGTLGFYIVKVKDNLCLLKLNAYGILVAL